MQSSAAADRLDEKLSALTRYLFDSQKVMLTRNGLEHVYEGCKLAAGGHVLDTALVRIAVQTISIVFETCSSVESSCALKGTLERWWNANGVGENCLSNGDFIAAVLLLGHKLRVSKDDPLNANFKLRACRTLSAVADDVPSIGLRLKNQ
jgi:hypothetical protein